MAAPREPTKMVSLQRITVKAISVPAGSRRKRKTMQQLEDTARRRWIILVAATVIAALAAGILIGRSLLS